MTTSDDLYTEIFTMPSEQQQQIISRIGAQYDTSDKDFIINTDTIYNYLIENNFRPPYTSEHINNFIDDITTPQYEEYFQERVNTYDYDDEITRRNRPKNTRIANTTITTRDVHTTTTTPTTITKRLRRYVY